MAILKDLIVQGVSKFLGTVYGEKFVKSGGTSSLFLKADGSTDSNTYVNTTSVDASPTNGSTNPVQSGGVYTALSGKQATLVSGTNIKSINSSSLLGSGNINLVSDVKQDNVSVVTNNVANIPHDVLQLDNWDFDSDMLGGSVTDALYATIVLAAASHKLIKVGNTLLTVYEDTDDYIVCGVTPNDMGGEIAVKSLAISKQSYSGEHYIDGLKLISDTTINELISTALSNYVPTSRKVNNKALSSNVTLKAGDIDLTTNITVDGTSKTTTLTALEAINTLATSKQDELVSGTNIKTVNNNSLVGSGNVQVGDITGEELEGTIVDLEQSLVTNALRKTQQTLSNSEKAQVLNNLGISDVVTSGGLKTINGSSIIGTGNLEVTVVDAGNINVAQSTGESTTYVMSQKAVSDKVERLVESDMTNLQTMSRDTRLPYGYKELDWISNTNAQSTATIDTLLTPNDDKWRFIGSWNRLANVSSYYSIIYAAGTGTTAYSYAIRRGSNNNSIYVNAYSNVNIKEQINLTESDTNVWHTFDIRSGIATIDGIDNTISTTAGTTDIATTLKIFSTGFAIQFGEFKAYHNNTLVADMIPCKYGTSIGMYDIIRNQFFISTTSDTFTAGNILGGGYDRVVTGGSLVDTINYLLEQTLNLSTVGDYATKSGIDMRLPNSYTQLKWISNENGANTLLTNYIPKLQSTRIIGSYNRVKGEQSVSNAVIFNAYTSNTDVFTMEYNSTNRSQLRIRCANSSGSNVIITMPEGTGGVYYWHTFDMIYGTLIFDGISYELSTTLKNTYNTTALKLFDANSTFKMRVGTFTVISENGIELMLIPCKNSNNIVGMYDIISKTFYSESQNGIDYTAGPVEDDLESNYLVNVSTLVKNNVLNYVDDKTGDSATKVMSQKAITDEINFISNKNSQPSYFTGVLAAFNLDNYPTLDIRKCDGISLVMDMYTTVDGKSMAFFGISNTDDNANALCYFIRNHWNVHGVGLFTQYGGTLVNGVTLNIPQNELAATHRVFTINFKTGECKIYRNGVLSRTMTPSTYDYNTLLNFFNTTGKKLWLGTGDVYGGYKISAMSLFGHVLSDGDVADIYGDGSDSVRGKLLKEKWLANWTAPHIINNWSLQSTNVTITNNTDNGGKICTVNSENAEFCRFGFTGIPLSGENAVRNNIIYEWDFEILAGSASLNYSMSNSGQNFQTWYVIDEQNNTLANGSTVSPGQTYHVVNKPDNLRAGLWDSSGSSLHLGYIFNTPSSNFSIWIKPDLKLTERGSALVFSTDTYRGDYWEMPSGIRIPNTRENLYNMMGHTTGQVRQKVYYDVFKPSTIIYSNNIPVQFNGQMAVDTTNGKVYVGYLTGTGGTWKQINNS